MRKRPSLFGWAGWWHCGAFVASIVEVLALGGICVAFATNTADDDVFITPWSVLSPLPGQAWPEGRYHHGAAALNDTSVLLLGGDACAWTAAGGARCLMNDVWRYRGGVWVNVSAGEPAQSRWSPRRGHGAAVVQVGGAEVVVVLGGSTCRDGEAGAASCRAECFSKEVWRSDDGGRRWARESPDEAAWTPRAFHSVVVEGPVLTVAGGVYCEGGSTQVASDVWQAVVGEDGALGPWTRVYDGGEENAGLAVGRAEGALAFASGCWYIYGGVNVLHGSNTALVSLASSSVPTDWASTGQSSVLQVVDAAFTPWSGRLWSFGGAIAAEWSTPLHAVWAMEVDGLDHYDSSGGSDGGGGGCGGGGGGSGSGSDGGGSGLQFALVDEAPLPQARRGARAVVLGDAVVITGGYTCSEPDGTGCAAASLLVADGDIICAAPNAPACVHGRCRGGACSCDAGWAGSLCAAPVCQAGPGDAGGCPVHSSCVSPGTCQCAPGWTGSRCEQQQSGLGVMVLTSLLAGIVLCGTLLPLWFDAFSAAAASCGCGDRHKDSVRRQWLEADAAEDGDELTESDRAAIAAAAIGDAGAAPPTREQVSDGEEDDFDGPDAAAVEPLLRH